MTLFVTRYIKIECIVVKLTRKTIKFDDDDVDDDENIEYIKK